MNKKIHWIEKTEDKWILLLKVEGEIYRIRIITKKEYDIKYTLYKYERFNEKDNEWTADITKSKTSVGSKVPITVFRNC